MADMRTVETIIETVYRTPEAAAEKLGVGTSAIWNWKAWGKFPARLAAPILQHARESNVDLDVSEIPLTDTVIKAKPKASDATTEAAQ